MTGGRVGGRRTGTFRIQHRWLERAVLDHDALGPAGGAGGVDDVGEVARGTSGRAWAGRASLGPVQEEDGLGPGRSCGPEAAWVRGAPGAGVLQHERSRSGG